MRERERCNYRVQGFGFKDRGPLGPSGYMRRGLLGGSLEGECKGLLQEPPPTKV